MDKMEVTLKDAYDYFKYVKEVVCLETGKSFELSEPLNIMEIDNGDFITKGKDGVVYTVYDSASRNLAEISVELPESPEDLGIKSGDLVAVRNAGDSIWYKSRPEIEYRYIGLDPQSGKYVVRYTRAVPPAGKSTGLAWYEFVLPNGLVVSEISLKEELAQLSQTKVRNIIIQ